MKSFTQIYPLVIPGHFLLLSNSPVMNCHFWHRHQSGSIVWTVSWHMVMTNVILVQAFKSMRMENFLGASTSSVDRPTMSLTVPLHTSEMALPLTGSFLHYPVIILSYHLHLNFHQEGNDAATPYYKRG